jgi:predicted AAA+ superfamily ATPase
MVNRQEYTERIRPFLGKPIIKSITGLRRVGKIVLVRQLMDFLKQSLYVPESNTTSSPSRYHSKKISLRKSNSCFFTQQNYIYGV